MAVYEVYSWIVSKGKEEKNEKIMEEFAEFIKRNPDLFKELKSYRYFKGRYGKPSGTNNRFCIIEFDSLDSIEKMWKRANEDERLIKIDKEWLNNIEINTFEIHMWEDMNRRSWIE